MFHYIFDTLYILINLYIFRRGFQALVYSRKIKIIYIVLFIFVVAALPLGSLFQNSFIGAPLNLFGSFWLASVLYFFLIIIILDLIRLLNRFFHFYPDILKNNYIKFKSILSISLILTVAISVTYGYWNNENPRIKTIDISINKKVDTLKTMNLAFLSDIHYGRTNGLDRFGILVEKINSVNPDIVIFGGDFFDGVTSDLLNPELGVLLKKIKSRFGVYSIIGNHDRIINSNMAKQYFYNNGVKILQDSIEEINNFLYLIGRRYYGIDHPDEKGSKNLEDLLKDIDRQKPIILIDHRPGNLLRSADNEIDLQLSGHTHYGQLWPLNYITDWVYELDWGYTKIKNTHYYVTCGVGTWGPPVRLGSFPEIVNIILHFE